MQLTDANILSFLLGVATSAIVISASVCAWLKRRKEPPKRVRYLGELVDLDYLKRALFERHQSQARRRVQ